MPVTKGLDDLFEAGRKPRLRRVYAEPMGLTVHRTPFGVKQTEPPAGEPLAEVRRRTDLAIHGFVQDARAGKQTALLVHVPPGVGKSQSLVSALGTNPRAARVMVGTLALAREQAAALNAHVLEGFSSANCQRFEVVQALQEKRYPVAPNACGTAAAPRCPFFSLCGYQAQFRQQGILIGAAEHMFNRRLWEGAELAVFDDADLTRTAIERTLVSGSHIDSATASYGVAGRKLLRVLGEALAAPGKPVAGPPLWDHLAATAAEYGEDLVALIERLPGRGFGMPAPLLGSDTLVLADVESLPGRGVAGLFTALREELPMFRQGNDFNSRIRIKNRSFEVARVRTIGSRGARPLADVPILVLDATPVLPLVQWVTEGHQRLPDVRGVLSLPDNVTVVQYASSSNGFRALSTPHRVSKVLEEIELERWRFPCTSGEEGLITSKQYLAKFASAGFSRVMTYGSVRGSNELADVRRLHVVGRPNPPPDETYFLAQVLHHDEEAVSPQAFMVERRYAGTNRGIDVVDYADPRMAALLHASREAEMSQVLHRARLFVRDDPVTVVLHTGHPVPGLRVDHLEQPVLAGAPINIERHDEAFERLGRAEAELRRRGDRCTAVALSREAKASRNTARKYLLETAKTGRAANQFADGGRRSGDK